MHKRSLLVLLLVLVATLLASPTSSVMAQSAATEKPVMFTYVSTFEVPRANWAEFQKAETNDDAALKKLVADGTISNYGTFNRVAHQEGEPTHGDWFSATSLGNLMKALDALVGSGASRDPVYNNTKHWDYIYESRDYDLHSGTFTNAYLRVGIFKFKEGADTPVKSPATRSPKDSKPWSPMARCTATHPERNDSHRGHQLVPDRALHQRPRRPRQIPRAHQRCRQERSRRNGRLREPR